MKRIIMLIYILCVLYALINAAPIKKIKEHNNHLKAFISIQSLGYMIKNDNGEDQYEETVKLFQETWDLKSTGEINEETQKWIDKMRCGFKDEELAWKTKSKDNDTRNTRSKRYIVLKGGGWPMKNLTYSVSNFNQIYNKTIISKEEMHKSVDKAFDLWARASPLNFTKVENGKVDVEITFARGSHCIYKDFDGPGRILAHAFRPKYKHDDYAGDIHLDGDERWTLERAIDKPVDLYQTVAHEIGHSLGLAHTKVKESIMYPYYKYREDFKLSTDDIAGINYLYSGPSGTTDFCSKSARAFSSDRKKRLFLFKGSNYAMVKYDIVEGMPHIIQEDYPELPSKVDAAVFVPSLMKKRCTELASRKKECEYIEVEASGFYIFREEHYYFYKDGVFHTKNFKERGKIRKKFAEEIPSDLDAVFTVKGLKFYFVKDDLVWRVTRGKQKVDKNYPKPLNHIFAGLPATGLKAAANVAFKKSDGKKERVNFFLFKDKYYTVTDFDGRDGIPVDKTPYKLPKLWFDCLNAVKVPEINEFAYHLDIISDLELD